MVRTKAAAASSSPSGGGEPHAPTGSHELKPHTARGPTLLERVFRSSPQAFWLGGVAPMVVLAAGTLLTCPVRRDAVYALLVSWLWCALASVVHPSVGRGGNARPYPIRPVAQTAIATPFQLLHVATNMVVPTAWLMLAKPLLAYHGSRPGDLTTAVSTVLFLSTAGYVTETVTAWPIMTSAPVWLGLTLCLSFCRTAAAYAWFAAARSANAASWSGIKAAAKGDAASMLTLLALPAAATSLALALIDLLYIQPLVELPAFLDSGHVENKPALHACWTDREEEAHGKAH